MCTADCLHKQEWWILMRSSCERRLGLYRHLFSISQVFGHWQLPIRNSEEWFGRWYEALATGHVPRCVLLPHRNAGRLHLEKAESMWFPGGSSHYRCRSAILVTTAMTQPPPLLSPSSLRLLPLPPFNEGLGFISPWENCGIKDVCRYVLEHFGGSMRLIIFPWNK